MIWHSNEYKWLDGTAYGKIFFPRTWILNPCAHYSCRVNCFDYFFMHYYLSTRVRKPLSSIIMKTCFYMWFLFFFALALSCPLYHQTLTLFTTGLCNNTKVHGDDRLKLPRQMRSVITFIIQNSQKNNPSWKCWNYFKRIPVRAWTGVWNFYYGIIQVIIINTICIFISTSIQRLQCSYVQCITYFSSCFLLHQFLMSVDISVNIRKLHWRYM